MINVIVITLLLLGFQILMNIIGEKIGYKLDKKYHVVSLILNLVCSGIMNYKYHMDVQVAPQIILLLITITILISSCMIDWKYQELPDSFNLVVAILGTIDIFLFMRTGLVPHIISAVALFAIFFLLAILTGGAVGGGDIKLMGALGLFFHYALIPRILIYGFFPGAVFGLILIILKKKKKEDMIAFGPFLVLGVILTMLVG